MAWTGGYKGANAGGISGATFLGGEPGGWLRYLIDTGINVDVGLNIKGLYGARFYVSTIGTQGTGTPAAGDYMCDFESTAEVVASSPFYVTGASPDVGTDPMSRPLGMSRLMILVRLRPKEVPAGITSVALLTSAWQIYRIT